MEERKIDSLQYFYWETSRRKPFASAWNLHHRLPGIGILRDLSKEAREDFACAWREESDIHCTGRGNKITLPSYPEWTVLTTLTPATGQVGFLGHSRSSSCRLPFQYGRKIGATSWDKKRSFFFNWGKRWSAKVRLSTDWLVGLPFLTLPFVSFTSFFE